MFDGNVDGYCFVINFDFVEIFVVFFFVFGNL